MFVQYLTKNSWLAKSSWFVALVAAALATGTSMADRGGRGHGGGGGGEAAS